MLETTGLKRIDVLIRATTAPFTTRSDYARTHAELVAICAVEGLITTHLVGEEGYGRVWYITVMGLLYLRVTYEHNN